MGEGGSRASVHPFAAICAQILHPGARWPRAYDAPVRRTVVLVVAGAALAVALVLTRRREWGTTRRSCPNWQALVLGLVQGPRSSCPISSSGHLILVPWLFDWTYLEENDAFNQTFDVALHLGTLVAVGAYFWHDLVALVRAWLGTLRTPADRDGRGAHRLDRRRGDRPGRDRRVPARGRDRAAAGRAVADRDLPRRRSGCCSAGPTGARARWRSTA